MPDRELLANPAAAALPEPASFPIVYQDDWLVAVHKPAGWLVHPSATAHRGQAVLLPSLEEQLGARLLPVHRLDRQTSGILLLAKDSAAAAALSQSFEERLVAKTYLAVVRGWLTPPAGFINRPLAPWPHEPLQSAETDYRTVGTIEREVPVPPHAKSRYSLLELHPRTGRRQQLRRHLAGLAHPIIGDPSHGDRRHNEVFARDFGCVRMLLFAVGLEFPHPHLGNKLVLRCPPDDTHASLLKSLFAGEQFP